MTFFSNNRSAVRPAAQSAISASSLTSGPTNQSALFSTRRLRAADKGGNTLASAITISALGKTRIADSVTRRDPDFFKLTVTTPVNVKLNFRNRSDASLTGSLLDNQARVVAFQGTPLTGTLAPNRRISFSSSIPPGTYYVKLSTRSNQPAQYELKLNAVDPAAPVDCGCTP